MKKKILFLQPHFRPPGGGNMVAAWMLQALADVYDVTALTWKAEDFQVTDQYYGTSLAKQDIRSLNMPMALRRMVDFIPDDAWRYQRYCALMRMCKAIKGRYDLIVTANNETDYGVKGLQYIHYPYLESVWLGQRACGRAPRGCAERLTSLGRRLRPWRLVSGFSFERMSQNLTLTNSDWTGRRIEHAYGTSPITLYPPVPGGFPEIPWHQRENGFVCLGRLVDGKRFERIIEVLAVVRRQHPDIHLHIIGSPVEYDLPYYQSLLRKVAEQASWVSLHEDLPRSELVGLVARHRYGIHGMENEHFGIAVAELVRAGCITFVHNSGGQVEIVGEPPALRYDSWEDAAHKISTLLESEVRQTALRTHLATRRGLFTEERFMSQFHERVTDFLRARNGH